MQAVEEMAAEQEKDRVMRMANILGFVVVSGHEELLCDDGSLWLWLMAVCGMENCP